ncbi:MAG: O-antigen translocase [Chitinophagaceae bacterium]
MNVKIRNAFKSDFVKVSAWSSISTLIKMVTSFVSIKIVAQIIGPSGLALVSQFLNSITILGSPSIGGISQGVTKYIAEYHDKPDLQRKVISNALRIVLSCTALVSLLVLIFSRSISLYIFNTAAYTTLIILLGLTLIFYSVNTILIAILNGFKSFRKYIIINVFISIAGLILSVLLVFYFGLYGALLNCILTQSVVLAITGFFVYREPWIRQVFERAKPDWKIIRKLGGFSLMALASTLFTPFSQIIIRDYISENLSLDSAGIWDAINRISGMYLLFVTTSIATFYLPRLSEIKEGFLLRREIIDTSKIVLPLLALTCLLIFLFRDFIIIILFSRDFMPMRNLFGAQMVGDFFKISSWLFAYLFWAKGMVKVFIITEAFFNISFVLLTIYSVNTFGLQGSAYAYAINYFIYLLIMLFIFKNLLGRTTA